VEGFQFLLGCFDTEKGLYYVSRGLSIPSRMLPQGLAYRHNTPH